MTAFARRQLRSVSPSASVAALTAAAAASYTLLVIGGDVGHRLGRIFIFVIAFVAFLTIACVAGALSRGPLQRGLLLGMVAAGFGTLGVLWAWINLFTVEAAVLLLAAAGLATLALVTAVITSHHRRPVLLSAMTGACVAVIILWMGLSISIAPTCGTAGRAFHIDSWHQPWSAANACSDGRLSFEFWP